mmetsp:Transcript_56520/g.104645  ORF Transcript_56520/g.104645 Transcript_56520/m.104645 type:complete len:234 (-) Transcript_56520:89-790(-)
MNAPSSGELNPVVPAHLPHRWQTAVGMQPYGLARRHLRAAHTAYFAAQGTEALVCDDGTASCSASNQRSSAFAAHCLNTRNREARRAEALTCFLDSRVNVVEPLHMAKRGFGGLQEPLEEQPVRPPKGMAALEQLVQTSGEPPDISEAEKYAATEQHEVPSLQDTPFFLAAELVVGLLLACFVSLACMRAKQRIDERHQRKLATGETFSSESSQHSSEEEEDNEGSEDDNNAR